jgi:uncharacterized protein involved in cysteine biosynthesis
LLFFWLLGWRRFPSAEEADEVMEALYALGDFISEIGLVVVVSFIAYLVGSVSAGVFSSALAKQLERVREKLRLLAMDEPDLMPGQTRPTKIRERLYVLRTQLVWLMARLVGEPPRGVDRPFEAFHFRLERETWEFQARLEAASIDRRSWPLTLYVGDLWIFNEWYALAMQLMVRNPTAFGQYDRIKSESEFRLAIVPPLFALIVYFILGWSLWWFAAVVGVVVLLHGALASDVEARDILYRAFNANIVQSPTIERLASEVPDLILGKRANKVADGKGGLTASSEF